MAKLAGVRPKGSGIEIRYQVGKLRRSVYVEKAPTAANLADAARYRKRLIQAAAIGGTEAKNATFEDCCRDFLADKTRSLKPSTVDAYRSKLEVYWSDLAQQMIRTIRVADLKAIDRRVEWRSQKTRREVHAVLRGVFDWAIHEELADENPARSLTTGAWQRPEIDAFTDAERAAILAELHGTALAFYGLMFETGARTGELMGLRWRDVTGDQLRIERSVYRGEDGSTKTHQARTVLLTAEAQRLLAAHTASKFRGEHIFLNQYGAAYANDRGLTFAFRLACKRAGVRYRRPYYCRHTFASRALSAGCEPSWVAQQMGDRLETVMRHYGRWISGDRDRAQLARLEQSGEFVGNGKRESS